MTEKCPTCGCDVTVGGEGSTHFYLPLQKDKERLKKIVREALRIVDHQDEQWSSEDTSQLIVRMISEGEEVV